MYGAISAIKYLSSNDILHNNTRSDNEHYNHRYRMMFDPIPLLISYPFLDNLTETLMHAYIAIYIPGLKRSYLNRSA